MDGLAFIAAVVALLVAFGMRRRVTALQGRLETLMDGWHLTRGGLYFVTPSARSRPAKITALANYLAEHLSSPTWMTRREASQLARK